MCCALLACSSGINSHFRNQHIHTARANDSYSILVWRKNNKINYTEKRKKNMQNFARDITLLMFQVQIIILRWYFQAQVGNGKLFIVGWKLFLFSIPILFLISLETSFFPSRIQIAFSKTHPFGIHLFWINLRVVYLRFCSDILYTKINFAKFEYSFLNRIAYVNNNFEYAWFFCLIRCDSMRFDSNE